MLGMFKTSLLFAPVRAFTSLSEFFTSLSEYVTHDHVDLNTRRMTFEFEISLVTAALVTRSPPND